MTRISTHVLDTAAGRPAAGVKVVLGDAIGVTDADGRIAALASVGPGRHTLVFAVDGPFFAEASLTIVVRDEEHLHVPLLMSPYGLTTYRGS